ncbi:MAG TPA: hypothetical protein VF669_04300 [Tepidisphaeraceae bacterium]|jgi:hypothetical protein
MKRIADRTRRRRSFWTPTRFELGICIFVVALWLLATIIVIKHEQVGWLVGAAYVLMGVIGACVSWLLLWPLLRILVHAMENE